MSGGAVRTALAALLGLLPILTALGLLVLAEWRDRRRAAAIACQVRLTDAISAELGGVVAPVVSRSRGARWRIAMRVPAARPALVSRALAITDATLRDRRIARYELVLTPVPASARRDGSIARRCLRAVRVPVARSTGGDGGYRAARPPVPAGRVPGRAARPRRSGLATGSASSATGMGNRRVAIARHSPLAQASSTSWRASASRS